VKVWIVTRFRFEHDEGGAGVLEFDGLRVPVISGIMSRHDEVMRLPGDTPAPQVIEMMVRKYEELYPGRLPEAAPVQVLPPPEEIWVGQEPRFGARLVEVVEAPAS
jgi:hypothetical protein